MSLKSALVKSAVAVALSSAATACSTVGSPAAKCAGVDPVKIGACSWSFRKPVSELDAEMRKAGVKGIQLALGPFIEADGRHGDAESAESLAYVKAKIDSN